MMTHPARLSLLLTLVLPISGCIGPGTPMVIDGGTLAVNERLRGDMGASSGMPVGRFLSDGRCYGQASGSDDECHFVSPVLGSLIGEESRFFTSRLRRTDNLWIATGNGFTVLSYELIGEGMTLLALSDPPETLGSDLRIATCGLFPAMDPETRDYLPPFQEASIVVDEDLLRVFDVGVRSCSSATIPPVSEITDLGRISSNCSEQSVWSIVGSTMPPSPQRVPLCLIDLGTSMAATDTSYTLVPGANTEHDVDLDEFWRNADLSPLPLETNLKVVPIGMTRTVSRPLEPTGRVEAVGEEFIHYFEFRVPLDGGRWLENFSPNIAVKTARVRRGPWTDDGGNYVLVSALKAGETLCKTRIEDRGYTEFDIELCEPEAAGLTRLTPAYTFLALQAGPVDDGDRLTWEVRLSFPSPNLDSSAPYFLELDLTAFDPVGSSSSGLTAAPAALDLGQVRVGQPIAAPGEFDIRNFGNSAVKVLSARYTGADAAEFGAPAVAAAAGNTLPFNLRGGEAFKLRVEPQFQSMALKRATMEVTYRNLRGELGTISMPITATAVTPAINLQPDPVPFPATPGSGPYSPPNAVRAALLTNDGPVAFQRLSVQIGGADAARFRVLAGESGLAATNLAQPLTLGPGESEVYRIGFYPERAGVSRATLTVNTSEGSLSVNLTGYCNENCEQDIGLVLEPVDELPPITIEAIPLPRIRRLNQ